MMSQRDKRAVLIVGIAAAVFLALEFGVLPLWDSIQAEREGLEVREQTFLKFQEALASRAEREAEKALLERQLREAEAGLLPGETPAIASAELRTRVQQLAAEHGIEVPSIQFLPEQPLGEDYVQVPLGIQLKGRIDGLVGFLEGCGTGPTTLRVLVLSIQGPGGASDPEKILTAGLRVAGIIRRPQDGGEER